MMATPMENGWSNHPQPQQQQPQVPPVPPQCSNKPLSPFRTVITSFTPRRRPIVPPQQRPWTGADNLQQSQLLSSLSDQDDWYEQGDWVLCLTTNGPASTTTTTASSVACALSNGHVQVYDAARLQLMHSFEHVPSNSTTRTTTTSSISSNRSRCITDLHFSSSDPQCLVSSASNGTLQLYDLRQAQHNNTNNTNNCALHVQLPSAALSVSLGYEHGHLAAVGSTQGRIQFVDWRHASSSSSTQTSAVVGSYVNCHQDDVTHVQFVSSYSPYLLSASEDGLVCWLDTTQPTEEAAVQAIVNANCPIRRVGLCGDHTNTNNSTIYCLTGNETVRLFALPSAHSLAPPLTRADLTQAWSSSSWSHEWHEFDYLVQTAHWDFMHQELLVVAGGRRQGQSQAQQHSSGDGALFRIRPPSLGRPEDDGYDTTMQQSSSSLDPNEPFIERQQKPLLQPLESLVGGHQGVLRAWSPVTTDGTTLVTAGEDARLCEWRRPPVGVGETTLDDDIMATTTTLTTTTMTRTPPSLVGTKRPPCSPSSSSSSSSPSALCVPPGSGGGGPLRRRQRPKTSLSSPY